MERAAWRDTETIVVKIGGAKGNGWMGLLDDLAHLHEEGARIVLVHGGSAETDRLAAALGTPAQTLTSPSGHVSRRTDRGMLEVFAQATALMNRRLVEAARGRGLDAFGFSGLDGGSVRARRKHTVRTVVAGRPVIVRDQWTGKITGVRASLFHSLLGSRLLPVVAPMAVSERGEMLNVDGDRLAAAVAAALKADRLVILSNVEGLRRDPSDSRTFVPRVSSAQRPQAARWARGRMKRKVLAVDEALSQGVPIAIIAASTQEHPLASALAGGGTHFFTTRRRENET